MLIFHGPRLVVFSIPRTGSTSLHEALRPHADIEFSNPPREKHMNVSRFERWCARRGESYAGYTRVAVMREPLARLGSWYRYRQRPEVQGTETSTEDMSFAEFIAQGLDMEAPAAANIGNQHRFVTREDGTFGVDEIFCIERSEVMRAFFAGHFGALTLGHRNASGVAPLTLSAALEARLRRARAAEFALYARVARTGRLTVTRG
ncbi:MAG: sulfotransferase family 2 domain-containing protein [Pseudomonadota bacterium]